VALGATIEIRSAEGSREVEAEEFFRGYLLTDLEAGEMVTNVRIPVPAAGYGLAQLVRRAGDFAIVAACALIELDEAGRCRHAALALGGVGPRPLRMRRAEALLIDRVVDDPVILEAAGAACDELSPESDIHASAAYRRAMARVMARRALRTAWDRAERIAGRAG
jgi:CO/xanthine dehydrogenase FAD-binding subunit